MNSRLAEQARQEQLEQVRRMSPEQRLTAFMRHSQLITRLYLAGRAAAKAAVSPGPADARE
jgi:hypothetical protein